MTHLTRPAASPSVTKLRVLFLFFGLAMAWAQSARAQEICASSITRPDDRYSAVGSGAEVKDEKTGLIWQRCSVGQTWNAATSACTGQPTGYQWQAAVNYASGLPAGSDPNARWRLPSQAELFSLVDQSCQKPSINRKWFPATPATVFWAAGADSSQTAYCVAFRDHEIGQGYPTDCWAQNNFPIRLVRGSGAMGKAPQPKIRIVDGATSIPADTGLTVTAADSVDIDGIIGGSVSWDFGDQSGTQYGRSASHAYAAPGKYTITLTTTDNQSISASVQQQITVLAVPVPTIGVVTMSSDSGDSVLATASVAFTAPQDARGITGYTAVSTPGGLSGSCTQSPCDVPGLTFGQSYTFQVSAHNASRSSAASAASSSVSLVTTPRPPQELTVTGAIASNSPQITVNFAAPVTGGSAITSYNVSIRASDSTSELYTPNNCGLTLPCVVTGVQMGKVYSVFATAANAQGSGSRSALHTVSLSSTPGISMAAAGPESGTAQIGLAPSVAGVSGYTVSSSRPEATGTCTTSKCTVTGLTSGIRYNLAVAANSMDGSATAGASANVEVVGGVAPSPTNVVATTSLSGVVVSFTAPGPVDGSTFSYWITNDVDGVKLDCPSSPCTFFPETGGNIRYSVTTYDSTKRQVSPAVASTSLVNAAVFNAPSNTSWMIPSGTRTLKVIAVGGGGGGGGVVQGHESGGTGGSGALAVVELDATAIGAATSLNVIAGGGGSAGANALIGGGGGGASGIQLGSMLLIAGGGGGGGSQLYSITSGHAGGDGGRSGGDGADGDRGGRGGGRSELGVGAASPCQHGTIVQASGNGGAGGSSATSSVGGSGVWLSASAANGGSSDSTACSSEAGGGGGGGGFGGGGAGGVNPFGGADGGGGGGGGGSTGPASTAWSSAGNGGAAATAGGRGRVIIFY